MTTVHAWLVLTNGSELRVVKRRPYLDPNEVAIEIKIRVPQPPRIIGAIDIELPEPPAVIVDSSVIQYPEDEPEEEAS